MKIAGILLSWFGARYMSFVVGRFLVGFGQVGFYISGFVLGMYTFICLWKIIVSTFRRSFVNVFLNFLSLFFFAEIT